MAFSPITVASYNVLHPYSLNAFSYLPAQGQDWRSRSAQVAQNILQCNADVVALQEIDQTNFRALLQDPALAAHYSGHHTKHDGHADKAKADGVALLYKTNRFTQMGAAAPSVHTIAPTAHSTTARRELYVDLQDGAGGPVYRCAVAHLEGGPQRQKGDQQLQEALHYIQTPYNGQSRPVDAYLIAADLNEDANAGRTDGSPSRFNILTGQGFLTDADRSPSEIGSARKIDMVFAKAQAGLALQGQGLVRSDLPPASDHHLVATTVQLVATPTFAPPPIPANGPASGSAQNAAWQTPFNQWQGIPVPPAPPPAVAAPPPRRVQRFNGQWGRPVAPPPKPSFGRVFKRFMQRNWKWLVPVSIATGSLAFWVTCVYLAVKHRKG